MKKVLDSSLESETAEEEVKEAAKQSHLSGDEVAVLRAEWLKGRKFKVRLDVLFSFGLLTYSENPNLENYMTAVDKVVKTTIRENELLTTYCWYDPGYGPCVQDHTTDDSYEDPRNRPNVRRILVIAAIPIFLINGISIREAREGICDGLQKTLQNGELVLIAKRGG
mmetsp:Transcript_1410/g.1916  ORF Transcript_1410/g.1916 Transcript_1410/m.1916 type:complete len:167 (+) Transcript_1410:99-599(+)